MNRLYLIIPFVLLLFPAAAQQSLPLKTLNFQTTYLPETNRAYLIAELRFKLTKGDSILTTEPQLLATTFSFSGLDPAVFDAHEQYISLEGDKLTFMISSEDQEFITQLSRQLPERTILIDQNLKFYTSEKEYYLLTADQLSRFSKDKLNPAAGHEYFLYHNFLRFGIGQGADQLIGALRFGLLNPYPWEKMSGFSYQASAYIGSVPANTLYFLKVYPLYIYIDKGHHLAVKTGLETDQLLDNIRLSNELSGSWTLPFQLWNFSKEYERFHLQPLVTAGVEVYHPLKTTSLVPEETTEDAFINAQFYGRVDYYFPVLKALSFHLLAEVFYDTNPLLNVDKSLFYNFRSGAAYDLGARTKIYLEFTKGYNDISLRQQEGILAGFAVEFF